MDQFIRGMDGEKYIEEIDRDIKEGRNIGVQGTPTFFVNGHRLVGARSMGGFVAIIEKVLKNPEIQLRSKTSPPDMPPPPPSKLSKMGSDSAPVLIEAFIDLLSPLSAPTIALLKTRMAQHESGVRIVIRHFPQMFHPEAPIIHQAALATGNKENIGRCRTLFWINEKK